jgi:hypothetical protein
MDESMRNVVLMFAGMLAVGWIFVLLDWLARRKERQSQHQQPPA